MAPWKRIYWAVWLSNLVTSIGMMSFLPFFPSHLESLGLTDPKEITVWTGVIFGSAPLMAAFMGPVWGAVGDRFGRRLMILRALFAIALFVGAMAFARTPVELLILRLMQGVFSGFVAPSITLVGVVAPADQQGRVTGSLQTALAAGTIVGPLLGAYLETALGVSSLFLCVAGAVLVSAVVVLLFVPSDARSVSGPEAAPPALRERESLGSAFRQFFGDLSQHLESPALRNMLFMIFGVQFAVGATAPQMELFVRELWEGDPLLVSKLTGVLFSALAISDLISMPLWGERGDRLGHGRMILRSSQLTGVALLLHAVVPVYALLALARFFLGFASAGVKPCSFGLLAEETVIERRGSAVGLVLSARQLAMSTAAMLGGLISAVVGLRGLFVLGGVGLLVSSWWIMGRVDRRQGGNSDAGSVEESER